MCVREKCGNEHDGNYGSGRFCSKNCARSFASNSRTAEIKEKCVIAGKDNLIKGHNRHNNPNNEKKCSDCGKIFYNKKSTYINLPTLKVKTNDLCKIYSCD
jgi:hypothetical protein